MNSERYLRPTDEQLELFKATFSDNTELLRMIRKALLFMPLSDNEKDGLNYLLKDNEALQEALRIMFLPELDGDMPLGQNIDLWMTMQFVERTPESAAPLFKAREMLITYLKEGLDNLTIHESSDKLAVTLTDDDEANYTFLIARNTLINHVDMVLNQIKALAGVKSESIEQTKSRLQKDSAK